MSDQVTIDADAARRQELGQFLLARRQGIQPEDVGIPRHGRRRVKGLRRHEVSDLAGVSVTWYTWLEQGRSIRTSPSVLDALARALRMDEDSRRHMRRLGGEPLTDQYPASESVDPNLVAMLDDLLPDAAYLMTRANDLVGWNAAYAGLFADPEHLPPEHRNAVWMMLLCDEIRTAIVDWGTEAREIIARFRAESAKFPGDARIAEVVRELNDASPLFRTEWMAQKVARFVGHVQSVEHPVVGLVRNQLLQLRPLDHPSLILMIHRPIDAASRERLERLLVLARAA